MTTSTAFRLERKVHQLVRNRIKPTAPIQFAFEDVRRVTIAKISVARGEAPVSMIGGSFTCAMALRTFRPNQTT